MTTIPSSAKTRAFSQEMESLSSWSFHSSHSHTPAEVLPWCRRDSSPIPQVGKGTRSIMGCSTGSLSFQLSHLCTELCVKGLLGKNAVCEERDVCGEGSGMSLAWPLGGFPEGQSRQAGSWLCPGLSPPLRAGAAWEGLTWYRGTLRIKLNMLTPKPAPSVTSALLSSEILTNQVEILPWIQPLGRKHYCTHCSRWRLKACEVLSDSTMKGSDERCCCCIVLINTWKPRYQHTQKAEKA